MARGETRGRRSLTRFQLISLWTGAAERRWDARLLTDSVSAAGSACALWRTNASSFKTCAPASSKRVLCGTWFAACGPRPSHVWPRLRSSRSRRWANAPMRRGPHAQSEPSRLRRPARGPRAPHPFPTPSQRGRPGPPASRRPAARARERLRRLGLIDRGGRTARRNKLFTPQSVGRGGRITIALHPRATCPTGSAAIKRAVMRAGAQINGFLCSEQRPSACKRWLGVRRYSPG